MKARRPLINTGPEASESSRITEQRIAGSSLTEGSSIAPSWRQWKIPRRRQAALVELAVRLRLAGNTATSLEGNQAIMTIRHGCHAFAPTSCGRGLARLHRPKKTGKGGVLPTDSSDW
jgi:hypothetical protein